MTEKDCPVNKSLYEMRDLLSILHLIFGGDGWAYDIGYGIHHACKRGERKRPGA